MRVTELPVGYWTETFKELIDSLTDNVDKTGKKITPLVKDYEDMSKDTNVNFTITFNKGKIDELNQGVFDHGCSGVGKILKLYSTLTTTNMHLFNATDKLVKYERVEDIIDEYYVNRLRLYQVRKDYLINALERELSVLSNKSKYIQENIDDTIDLRKKNKMQVISLLSDKGYDIIDGDKEYKYLR